MLDLWLCLMPSPQIRDGGWLQLEMWAPSLKQKDEMGSTCIIYVGKVETPQNGLMLHPMN